MGKKSFRNLVLSSATVAVLLTGCTSKQAVSSAEPTSISSDSQVGVLFLCIF